jgi:hypothetical protein
VCHLQLLLTFSSAVILGFESRGTHDHILLSQIRESPNLSGGGPRICISQEQVGPIVLPGTGLPFCRLLRLTGLRWIRRSVKLLLVFASAVIPGFSLFRIHDQYFYSPLDMYTFRNLAFSSTKEGSVFLFRRYVCCTIVSA